MLSFGGVLTVGPGGKVGFCERFCEGFSGTFCDPKFKTPAIGGGISEAFPVSVVSESPRGGPPEGFSWLFLSGDVNPGKEIRDASKFDVGRGTVPSVLGTVPSQFSCGKDCSVGKAKVGPNPKDEETARVGTPLVGSACISNTERRSYLGSCLGLRLTTVSF